MKLNVTPCSLPLFLILFCAAATPAAAQTATGTSGQTVSAPPARTIPAIDMAAGYAFLYDSDRGGAMPAAWLAGLAVGLTPRLSLVGEIDGAYTSELTSDGEREYRTHTFMAGLRQRLRPFGKGTPFAQVLIGVSCYCGSSAQVDGGYDRGAALQLGGGVDLPIAGPIGVRVQADYRHVWGEDLGFNQMRLAVGGVVNITRR